MSDSVSVSSSDDNKRCQTVSVFPVVMTIRDVSVSVSSSDDNKRCQTVSVVMTIRDVRQCQ